MRRLIIFAIITVFTVAAAACGGAATNSSNAALNNAAANNAANSNRGANSRHGDEMPMMNGNHQRMGDQHRDEGRTTENRQMRRGMQDSANNSNANK